MSPQRRIRPSSPERIARIARLMHAARAAGYRVPEHGWQTALARDVGISQSVLNRLLRGEREPELTTVKRIADFLGVRAGWLAFGELPERDGDSGDEGVSRTRRMRHS